ncbi:MAG TPA: PHP domain-containing protein [Bacteroidales bacterium]|nr:PHP domain-containing protein [Bacteroidales bacterium]
MNWLTEFPDEKKLLSKYPEILVTDVNAHLHTPYSFSAFNSIEQIFQMALKEGISAAGINDFFVTDGYSAFYEEALKTGVFPLFNIEFTGLLKKHQQQNIRINDPNNPGRCYFCGKGLDYPFQPYPTDIETINRVIELSREQIRSMIHKVNLLFSEAGSEIQFSYEGIQSKYAKNLVRERHVACAVREAVYNLSDDDSARKEFLLKIYDGKPSGADLHTIPAIENEIRSNLLKAGGKAFVEEDEATFPAIDEIIRIIRNAGGIPCYPVLLDDVKGNYTEFESSPERLSKELQSWDVNCIELIPGRNDAAALQKFVHYFHNAGFIVLMGTEHNSPGLIPLICDTRGKIPLTDAMRTIAYEGACVVAAHQYRRARRENGFQHSGDISYFLKLGNAVILHHMKTKSQKHG